MTVERFLYFLLALVAIVIAVFVLFAIIDRIDDDEIEGAFIAARWLLGEGR